MPAAYRTTTSRTMRTAPPTGAKVAQLRTLLGPNMCASLLVARGARPPACVSTDEEVEKDDGEPASEGAVEIGLDPAGLDAPQRATALDRERRDGVHGSVHEPLVDPAVDAREPARDRAGEVHERVDDVGVEPRHGAREGERGTDHHQVVQL